MKPPRLWTALAFAQPGLFVLLWSFTSPAVRLAIWCHWGLARLAFRHFDAIVLLSIVIIAANALIFIVHALRNGSVSWGMRLWWATAILLFSPIMAPLYWMVHLRKS
jgi:hypothetical protein